MKYNHIPSLLLLSAGILSTNASDRELAPEKKKKIATQMIYQHFVTPITPAKSMRAFMSRRVAMPAMWYETEVFDEDPETPGELLFRVKERHLTAGKKPHPRDGLIIHTGFFKTDTKKTYVFDRKSKKHLPADKHPAVVQALNKKNERIKKQVKSIRNLQVLLNARGFDQKKK